ncbi:hypothetical protein FRB99_004553 [Tulasnella sp. 403]|nr:hypothetical protein FRB99_004553 [Tulasnella sp. 403]
MHSFTDCAAGVALGTSIWLAQWSFGDILAKWISSSGWQVPLITIPLGLSLVNQHPDPVDDCPCFEDAIAFLSVLMGVTLSQWWRANWGFDEASGHFQSRMPSDWPMWTLIASAKMVLGVFIIFAFRLVAKPTLLAILPPIFRGLSTLFTLPNRRYYTPATDYQSVPREPLLHHPIPSVIDLPTLNTQQESGVSLPTSRNNKGLYGNTLKLRGTAGNGNGSNHTTNGTRLQEKAGNGDAAVVIQPSNSAPPDKVKHYDADVLTKVIVYAGIAFLASGVIPVLVRVPTPGFEFYYEI